MSGLLRRWTPKVAPDTTPEPQSRERGPGARQTASYSHVVRR